LVYFTLAGLLSVISSNLRLGKNYSINLTLLNKNL
jgi:hypothetical protein